MTVTLELKCKVVNAVLQHMQINTYAILLYWERVFQKCSCFALNLIRIFVLICSLNVENFPFIIHVLYRNRTQ